MTILNTQTISIPAINSILSAWNTIPISISGRTAFTIPVNTKFIELTVFAQYVRTSTAAPDNTGLKNTYVTIQRYRPCVQLANAVSGIYINTILNPFGNASATTMTATTPYDVQYTICIPIPTSLATGNQTISLMLAPEQYGSTALNYWQFNTFTGTVRCFI